MAGYASIVTTTQAIKDQIGVGLVKQAALRAGQTANQADQRERQVCAQIINGTAPAAWTTMVLIELDIAGQAAAPTDPQIDTVITTGVAAASVASVWSFLIASRS